MPVTLQQVDQSAWEADAQIRLDLVRIFADAPAERLPLPVEDFIRVHLEGGHLFSCARFNDRLLGAVAVKPEQDAWWLSNLCVRKTTRRRGVGSRLLALVSEAAQTEGRRLYADNAQLPVADQMLLTRLGYRLTKDGDYFELDLSPRGDKQ
ncbi:acetyl-CoA sensor PanZ family protein [Halomonas aquatica]|uniref:Acetyl-CoA sensor PanZ family protein n=1 Tax=Halomonas aquatica TaxID=3151123 RepID=A0ABV1NDQ3_9GAMM